MTTHTPQIDADLINSLHHSIQQSDQNAATLLDILYGEIDLTSMAMAMPSDNNAALPIYLHAVYHGAAKTQMYFGQHIDTHSLISTIIPDVTSQRSGLRLSLQGANDVCWAALSDHPDALATLTKTYESLEKDMGINARTARAISTQGFRDQEARNLTPLDITIQYYIAHKTVHAAHAQDSNLPDILQLFLRNAGATKEEEEEEEERCPVLQNTEKNIWDLLDKGAKGSKAAYFPTSLESLENPFVNNEGFEIMSLTEFCNANSHYLPTELVRALCPRQTQAAPSRTP